MMEPASGVGRSAASSLAHRGGSRSQLSGTYDNKCSAAAIAAQGFIRLGQYLAAKGSAAAGRRYLQAGLTIADTIFNEPYLSADSRHQGLLLHSVYHRPNGWDHVPRGRKVPCGEACMWGDYHAMELALLIRRLAEGRYYTFF